MKGIFVLRDQSVISSSDTEVLVRDGIRVWVEGGSRSQAERVGAIRVAAGSWREAPLDAFVIGRELPLGNFPLVHRHLCFAPNPRPEQLVRFLRGGGTLLDLSTIATTPGELVTHLRGLVEGTEIWLRAERAFRRRVEIDRRCFSVGYST